MSPAARSRKGVGSLRPLAPSPELAAIVGDEPLARTEIVKRVWGYIREHGLQDPADRRVILPDDRLRAVFGRDRVGMLSMMGLLSPHLRAVRGRCSVARPAVSSLAVAPNVDRHK